MSLGVAPAKGWCQPGDDIGWDDTSLGVTPVWGVTMAGVMPAGG